VTKHERSGYEFLEQGHLVLLALQFSLVVSTLARDGVDGLRGGIVGVLAVTVFVFIMNRRLARDDGNRSAARWIIAWRSGVLAVLAVATLLVALDQSRPIGAPESVRRLPFVMLWVVICLKGAAVGKLKPGGLLGLRVYWTLRSHLAWDKAHRTLGRILFGGGLVGLAASPVLPPPTSLALLVLLVATGVILALAESWQVWRSDPERAS
jgi:uncharacterized membrane protein